MDFPLFVSNHLSQWGGGRVIILAALTFFISLLHYFVSVTYCRRVKRRRPPLPQQMPRMIFARPARYPQARSLATYAVLM
jgi:uncharacterized protein YneF (UPF0154 family)